LKQWERKVKHWTRKALVYYERPS